MNTGAEIRQQAHGRPLQGIRAGSKALVRAGIMVNVSREGQVFKCEICGNVVIVKESGGGELVCCGEPMQLEE